MLYKENAMKHYPRTFKEKKELVNKTVATLLDDDDTQTIEKLQWFCSIFNVKTIYIKRRQFDKLFKKSKSRRLHNNSIILMSLPLHKKTTTFQIRNWKSYIGWNLQETFTILHHRILKVAREKKKIWMNVCVSTLSLYWVLKELVIFTLHFTLFFMVLNTICHWHSEVTEHFNIVIFVCCRKDCNFDMSW